MNCKKCRALIFEYRDGTRSPRQMEELDAHLAVCPLCRAEFDAEEKLAHGFRESFKAAAASVCLDPDKALTSREISISSKDLSSGVSEAAKKAERNSLAGRRSRRRDHSDGSAARPP